MGLVSLDERIDPLKNGGDLVFHVIRFLPACRLWSWPTVSPRPSGRPRRTLRRWWDEKGVPVSLWMEDQRGAADPLPFEGDGHLDAIGDPDERNAAVHPELLAVERHRPLDLTGARAFPGDRQQ